MTAPIVHTTVTELATERFWVEHIDPVARAHGIEMPTTLDRDLDDHQAHLLKDAAGKVILTVRTDLEDTSRKDEPPPFEDLAPRPTPQDGEAYRAYALISNHLHYAFSEAGLFVLLSRREHMARLVWNELVSRELRMPL